MQCRGKCKIQTQENGKKLHFEPDLVPLGPNSGRQNFFFKNLASPVTRYHSQLSCTMPEKTKDPILRTFSDGWTDRNFLKDVYKETFSIFFKAILNFIAFDINRLIA